MLFLFVLGTGLSTLAGHGVAPGISFKTLVYPGLLAMSVLFTAIFSAASIVWDREFGFPREMLGAPVSRSAIVIGKCLGGATVATFQGIIILALAAAGHVPYDPIPFLTVIGELLLLSFTLTAFGVMMAARIKQMQAFMALTQMLVMPLFFLSGALSPLSGLPTWLTILTRFDLLTYIVKNLKETLRCVRISLGFTRIGIMGPVSLGSGDKKGDAGWLRGQTTRRRIHRRSDGGPERRQWHPDGGPGHRYEWYTESPPYVSRPNFSKLSGN